MQYSLSVAVCTLSSAPSQKNSRDARRPKRGGAQDGTPDVSFHAGGSRTAVRETGFHPFTSTAYAAEGKPIKIGFLPGVVDPFYQVMQLGVESAAKQLGIEVVTEIPQTWGVEVQTPILDFHGRPWRPHYIITAPTDKDQMIGPLKAAADAGIKVITVDTFLGDGDYATGPVTFPVSYIGSDNIEGGRISAPGQASVARGSSVQFDKPECELGRGPRKGLQGGHGEGISRH